MPTKDERLVMLEAMGDSYRRSKKDIADHRTALIIEMKEAVDAGIRPGEIIAATKLSRVTVWEMLRTELAA